MQVCIARDLSIKLRRMMLVFKDRSELELAFKGLSALMDLNADLEVLDDAVLIADVTVNHEFTLKGGMTAVQIPITVDPSEIDKRVGPTP